MWFIGFLCVALVLVLFFTAVVIADTAKSRKKDYPRVLAKKAARNVDLREAEARIERERAAGEA